MAKRMMVASANPPSRMYKILFLSKLEPEVKKDVMSVL